MKKPNFFIIGAPKCGTTALSYYLSEHSNVYISDPKEPQFFCKDIYKDEPDRRLEPFRYSLDGYLNLFRGVNDHHLAIGEASPQYIISHEAIDNILAFDHKAKLIVMVRNPVDLVYSFHSQNVFNLEENVTDFKKAWSLNEPRRRGDKIPAATRRPKLLFYDEVGAIGTKIESILEKIPREQLHIIFLDDLKISTQSVYSATLNFLGVPDDGRTSFPVINENKSYRSRLLATIMGRQSYSLKILRYYMRKILGINGTGMLEKFQRNNVVKTPRDILPAAFRMELISFFANEIEKLETITRRDLSNWRL